MDWIEINLPYVPVYDDNGDSFLRRGLNKAGVLIRMVNGREYLIGHINENQGVCDCCTKFDDEEIVAAYKIVWEPSTTN